MAAAPIFPNTIQNGVQQILPADTTTLKTLYTAAAGGSIVHEVRMASTDTTNRDVQFYVTVSGTDYLIGTIQCPLNAGFTNAVPSISVLDNAQIPTMYVDVNGNRCMFLASGSVLKAKALTTVTAAKAIQFFVQAGDF